MQEQKFVKALRTAKIVQLCLLLVIEITFFLVLTYNAGLRRQIFSNRALFALCAITWILMLYTLFCLLFDFTKLRYFASESHSLTKAAYLDSLTGIPNRYSLDVIAGNYTTTESLSQVACAMFTISNLKEINDSNGHKTGDLTIRNFCTIFEEVGDPFGFVGRNGGNQFIALFDRCCETDMNKFISILEKRVSLYNKEHTNAPIEIRHAMTICSDEPMQTFTQLLTTTYGKLHPLS